MLAHVEVPLPGMRHRRISRISSGESATWTNGQDEEDADDDSGCGKVNMLRKTVEQLARIPLYTRNSKFPATRMMVPSSNQNSVSRSCLVSSSEVLSETESACAAVGGGDSTRARFLGIPSEDILRGCKSSEALSGCQHSLVGSVVDRRRTGTWHEPRKVGA